MTLGNRWNYLVTLKNIFELEKDLNFKGAEWERRNVSERLLSILSYYERTELTQNILKLQNKQINEK